MSSGLLCSKAPAGFSFFVHPSGGEALEFGAAQGSGFFRPGGAMGGLAGGVGGVDSSLLAGWKGGWGGPAAGADGRR